jgi:lipoprotein-releasing system permease protein
MYRYFLSWRYLLARKTNRIGIVGILVGVGAMILILSIMSGFLGETRAAVRGSLSDLVIEPVFLPRPDGYRVPDDPAPALEVVRADPRVAAATAQLQWFGMIKLEDDEADVYRQIVSSPEFGKRSGVALIGIDAEDYLRTTDLGTALRREPPKDHVDSRVADPSRPFDEPPDYVPSGRRQTPVLVGEQLAESWGLRRGQEFTVVTSTLEALSDASGDTVPFSNKKFVVAGTFRSQENELDLGTIFFPRDALESFLGHRGSYSQILVRLHDYEKDGQAVREELEQELLRRGLLRGGMRREVNTWEDFKETLLGAIENERVLMAIMLSLVLLVAGFTIFAILSMMVTEKRRDIGILSALGATPRGIQTVFVLIAFWDALLGATLGAVAGVVLAFNIDPIERWLSGALGVQIFNRNVYLFDHIPATVNPWAVALIVLFAFVCALAFAFLPAVRAGRLHPLDALRYE